MTEKAKSKKGPSGSKQRQKTKNKKPKQKSNNQARIVLRGTMQHTFIKSRLQKGVQADNTMIDVDPLPIVLEQQLAMSDSANFVINAAALFTSGDLAKSQVDADYPGKVMSLNWVAPSRYVDPLGNSNGGATLMDARGVLVAVDYAVISYSNQLACPVKLRYNTPKARMPQQGNVSYRTDEKEVEIVENGTVSVKVKWANSINDCPVIKVRAGNESGGSVLSNVVPLVNYYAIISDIDQYTGSAFVGSTDALRVNVKVHYRVHTPTTAFAGETSDTVVTPARVGKFEVEDLSSLQNCYQLDPPLESPDSGNMLFTPKPERYFDAQGNIVKMAPVFLPYYVDLYVVNGNIATKKSTVVALVRTNYNGDTNTLYLMDFKNAPDTSMVKYPSAITMGGMPVSQIFKKQVYSSKVVAVKAGQAAPTTFQNANEGVWILQSVNSVRGSDLTADSVPANTGWKMGPVIASPTMMDYACSGVKKTLVQGVHRTDVRGLGTILVIITAISQVVKIIDTAIAAIKKQK